MTNLSGHVAEIHAVGLSTAKSIGEAAEAAFLATAASLGFGVAKPWGDSERYDFIIDSGFHFWRVQVKSSQLHADSAYQIKTSGWKNRAYTRREIDFLIAYIIPENLWYVVPIEAVGSRTYLRFYPPGTGRPSPMEKYHDAWCQMACPRNHDGPVPIHVARRCTQLRRQDPCPLCVS